MEIWKPVLNYEGLYEVSNFSRVRSLPRDRKNAFGTFSKTKGKIMNGSVSKIGYLVVTLCGKNSRSLCYVHRLVSESFIPNPNNKPQVNHINGIKTDNRIENLEWVTHKENGVHAFKIGLNKPGLRHTGKNHFGSKPVICKNRNGDIIHSFDNARMASKELGVSFATISAHCVGKINRDRSGNKWEFNHEY